MNKKAKKFDYVLAVIFIFASSYISLSSPTRPAILLAIRSRVTLTADWNTPIAVPRP